jgi:aarF domain-containing kinase
VLLQVTLKATVSTVVVTTLVLEGWSRELNPDLHIMDALRDMLAVDWKERLSRAVDKVGGGRGRSAVAVRVPTCV